jgi:preprotein translocase subunit SecY
MFKTIRNAWAIPDLRKKILFTFFIIVIFRIGAQVPVPFLNPTALKAIIDPMVEDPGNLISYLNVMSGGAFENATLFAMGVTPYINSSIIMNLLTVAIPALERLQKEGEEGRKKVAQITRYVTILLGIVQGFAFYMFLRNSATGSARIVNSFGGAWDVYVAVVIILVFTAGTALMMWLGEQINQKGIGNGISILLFAGIVSSGPTVVTTFIGYWQMGMAGEIKYFIAIPAMVLFFIFTVGFIVFMNGAERRIPVQYAKRVVGRKMYGGQSTHIPIKVNMSGVLPIIFASSIVSIPGTIKMFVYGASPTAAEMDTFWYKVLNAIGANMYVYAVLFFVLIIAFAYFYVTIQYNPIEMANNLRKNSGTIPGIRPGKPTSTFIQKILSRITLIGALFLSVIAVIPIIIGTATGINMGMSGTSVIILVGVALETVQQIESQMLMRHYKGFLE